MSIITRIDAAWERYQKSLASRRPETRGLVETGPRTDLRFDIAEAAGDSFLQERILGKNDLLPVNYLARGMAAARAVCRIDIRDRRGRSLGFGSGFLVGDGVLLTNNHVLPSSEVAWRSLAVFDFEDDEQGNPKPVATFELSPERLFVTDEGLDYTFVAVSKSALDRRSLSSYGTLDLIADSGKALEGETVNLVQHPQGAAKHVAIRESEVVGYEGPFVHYSSDTDGGSSGSPVFNDQWFVVALHHASVAEKDASGTHYIHRLTGQPITDTPTEDIVKFIANEGVRISSIHEHLSARTDLQLPVQQALLSLFKSGEEAIAASLPSTDEAPIGAALPAELLVERLGASSYSDRDGYQVDFLGLPVPLPRIPDALLGDVAPVKDRADGRLDYRHFSVVMSKSRRLALFTACNIDGKVHKSIKRGKDVWYLDGRLHDDHQTAGALYARNDLDRGHLVRREDPNWGQLAAQANDDTFHFTNCSPQHSKLNQKTWLDLENHILSTARDRKIKVTVFTGPVFREEDLVYRGTAIPAEFWKVVVTVHEGKLAAAAYLQSQRNLLGTLEFAYGKYKTYAVPVAMIERLTRLDFGPLRTADKKPDTGGAPHLETWTPDPVREVLSVDDIQI